MNIALLAHLKYPIAEPFHGGLEMHTHILAKGLMSRGHDVTLYATKDSDPCFRIRRPRRGVVQMDNGVDLFADDPNFGKEFIETFHVHMDIMVELQRSKYDLVHNNSLNFLPLAMAHTLPCPMVSVLHTPPFPSLQSGAIIAHSYLGNHFVAVSDFLGRDWSPYIGKRYSVVPNGIEMKNWPFNEKPTQRTAVWFGRFCPEKGAEYAIAAANRAGFKLKLAGSIYDRDYFAEKIAPHLDENIEYVGHLDHHQLGRLISKTSVGLFTSVWDEPFGLVIPEMLACGTPVVAFDSGAAGELLHEACGRLVPKRDTDAMAAAMPIVADFNRMACRSWAVRNFQISQMIDGYEEIYHRVTGVEKTPRTWENQSFGIVA